ncbi:MAG: hypothetical protein F6J87_00520 [Spirulina sp. SIO3F2]|nr:hypothetical protein [Spirulina sp. SIO3F2]
MSLSMSKLLCSLLFLPIAAVGLAVSAQANDLILPGRCHMGQCWENKFLGKTPLQAGPNGTLYAVELALRIWPIGTEPSSDFDAPRTSYIYCSTTRPAIIFRFEGDTTYYGNLLNPGGDNWSGATQDAYPIYWATCHNFVGPDFFSQAMTTKAIELGYPLNLPNESLQLANPLEIMNE